MRRVRVVSLAAAVSMVALGLTVPAQAQPVVVGADALSEVRPEGARVVAVVVELTEDLPMDLGVPLEDLTVTVEDRPRTVTDAYVTDATQVGAAEAPGPYLYLALDPTDDAAPALYPDDLVGAYTVTLATPVTDDDDAVLLPAFEVANRAVLTAVADDFTEGAFTGSAGTTLTYRLFTPGVSEDDEVPLVVFLHGGGEVGADNVAQLTANRGAIAFADPQWQADHPAYVLAPQLPLPADSQWEQPDIQATLAELIDTVATLPAVDTDRLYLTGLSRGARGALQLLPTDPDTFAGALLAAGRASRDGSTEHVAAIVDLPLWATHSIDDDVVDYTEGTLAFMSALEEAGAAVTRGTWSGSLPPDEARAAAAALRQEAEAAGAHTLFTTYAAGTTPVAPHFSWIPTYDNDVMLEWLFAQARQPAEPTPPPTPTPTPAPSDSAPTESSSPLPTDDDASAGPASGPGRGQLAATGAPALLPAGLAVALLIAGALAFGSRRVREMRR